MEPLAGLQAADRHRTWQLLTVAGAEPAPCVSDARVMPGEVMQVLLHPEMLTEVVGQVIAE